MSLRDEIRDLIGDFYDGELTAIEFRERFAPLFYDGSNNISDIQNLLIDIDGMYVDYMSQRIDETELRKRLFELLPSTRVQLELPEVSNSAEVWNVPVASTRNYSSRLPSRSTRTNKQTANLVTQGR